jgi:hypothetical protein
VAGWGNRCVIFFHGVPLRVGLSIASPRWRCGFFTAIPHAGLIMPDSFLSSCASFLYFWPGSPNLSAAVHWVPLSISSLLCRK